MLRTLYPLLHQRTDKHTLLAHQCVLEQEEEMPMSSQYQSSAKHS